MPSVDAAEGVVMVTSVSRCGQYLCGTSVDAPGSEWLVVLPPGRAARGLGVERTCLHPNRWCHPEAPLLCDMEHSNRQITVQSWLRNQMADIRSTAILNIFCHT